jgi:hypothetical protein
MNLTAGARMRSTVDPTEVIVVKAPAADVDLRCGGQPVAPIGEEPVEGSTIDAAHQHGTQLGKRYADPDTGLEVLCTKGGDASLSLGDEPLPIKDAKALPSSD